MSLFVCKFRKKNAKDQIFSVFILYFAHFTLLLHPTMQYNTATLPNGLRIIHLPLSSPVVYCGYEISAGTRHEQKGEEGLAHFCEHATFKGTARRKSMQIINALESVGGDMNAFTNKEETVYYAAITREHIAKATDVLTDIVFNSVYPEAELKKEIEVVCDEIESYNDSPSELIYDEFENMVFAGHPLGHSILGNAEQLRTYSHEQTLAFARRMYTPDRMVFFAYGDVDFNKLVKMLQKATEECSVLSVQCSVCNEELRYGASQLNIEHLTLNTDHTVVKTIDTHQAHVMTGNIAYGIHDDRRIVLYLLNNILGGPSMNSRLNLALRERKGLVYTVDSSIISYSDTGVWSVYFGCDPDDTNKCLRIVRHELDKMMQKPLSAQQLTTAKRQIKGQIAIANDNRENFALDFAKSYLHFGCGKDPDALIKKIEAIKAEDIQTVAQELFNPEQMYTLIYK